MIGLSGIKLLTRLRRRLTKQLALFVKSAKPNIDGNKGSDNGNGMKKKGKKKAKLTNICICQQLPIYYEGRREDCPPSSCIC